MSSNALKVDSTVWNYIELLMIVDFIFNFSSPEVMALRLRQRTRCRRSGRRGWPSRRWCRTSRCSSSTPSSVTGSSLSRTCPVFCSSLFWTSPHCVCEIHSLGLDGIDLNLSTIHWPSSKENYLKNISAVPGFEPEAARWDARILPLPLGGA